MTVTNSSAFLKASCIALLVALVCSTQFYMMATCQQAPSTYGTDSSGTLTIQGLENVQGFTMGQNRLSFAIQPTSRDGDTMYFNVVGLSITDRTNNRAVFYPMRSPLPAAANTAQNTLQIDTSGLRSNIGNAQYINADAVYNSLRSDVNTMVLDIDMTYQSRQDAQTIFTVNAMSTITPDGKMQAFSMQKPARLIIDPQSQRIAVVTFPQLIETFNSFYGATYTQVLPVVFAQPVPVLVPVFVPVIKPFPIPVFQPKPRPTVTGMPGPIPSGTMIPSPKPTGTIIASPKPTGTMIPSPTPGVLPTGIVTPTKQTGQLPTLRATGIPTGIAPTQRATGVPTFQPTVMPTGVMPTGQPVVTPASMPGTPKTRPVSTNR